MFWVKAKESSFLKGSNDTIAKARMLLVIWNIHRAPEEMFQSFSLWVYPTM